MEQGKSIRPQAEVRYAAELAALAAESVVGSVRCV